MNLNSYMPVKLVTGAGCVRASGKELAGFGRVCLIVTGRNSAKACGALQSLARKEYDDIAKKEVQKAFVYSYEESAKTLMNNYLDNVEAFCNKSKIRDVLTGEEINPDEKLMRSIEEQIGISENAKKAFREEILIRISAYARKGNGG